MLSLVARPKVVSFPRCPVVEDWRQDPDGYRRLLDALPSVCGLSRPVAFVNGCFDLIHPGHVWLLAAVRDAARRLLARDVPVVVAVNTDPSVRVLKGPGRPFMTWWDRALTLSGLADVAAVVGFSEPTAAELVADLRPRVYGKGEEYRDRRIPETDVLPADAVCVYVPEVRPCHSSYFLSRINAVEGWLDSPVDTPTAETP